MFDSRPTVAWPPTTVAWPFSDSFQICPNCLKRRKNVVWQSADGRGTSDHCRVTVQWFFSKIFQIACNVQKRCLAVGRRSGYLRPLSRDRSVTFFKIFPNCLKRRKNVVRQSANGRVTSDHCRVTVQWFFSKFFLIAWNAQKTLFDSRPSVAWPPTTVAWPLSDFFQRISWLLETSRTVVWQSVDGRVTSDHCRVTVHWLFQNLSWLLETSKNVVWQSADGRGTSDHCRVTVQCLFWNIFLIAWNVKITLSDSRTTVAWPPTTVAWPFGDFFRKISKLLVMSKNVVWQSADGRVTSDHCRVTVQRLFSEFVLIAWNVEKTLFDSRLTVAWPPTTVAWPFSDFFQNFSWLLETPKKRCLTVGRRSRDLRPLSRDR